MLRKLRMAMPFLLLASFALVGCGTPTPVPTVELAVPTTAPVIPTAPVPISTPTSLPTLGQTQPVNTAAPSLTAQPESANCLVGTWQMNDPAAYINSILPKGNLRPGDTVNVNSTTGTLQYIFDEKGVVTANAKQFKIEAGANLAVINLNIEVALDGAATGEYQADPATQHFTLLKATENNMNVSATVNGISILQESPSHGMIWFGEGTTEPARISYTCSGDSLTINFSSTALKPLALTRVTP